MMRAGWKITYNPNRPVTGTWRAERFGVGLSAGNKEQLLRMIDTKNLDEREWRRRRKEGG